MLLSDGESVNGGAYVAVSAVCGMRHRHCIAVRLISAWCGHPICLCCWQC